MSKLRSISQAFWSDPYIEELSVSEKLLYLYLLTNDKTNMLGIYEISISKISFETGIAKNLIESALEKFSGSQKVKYVDNYVLICNYLKHQNYNTNMKKSAVKIYNNLPEKFKYDGIPLLTEDAEGFRTLSKPFEAFQSLSKIEEEEEYEYEEEKEEEREKEKESENASHDASASIEIYPTFDDFWDLYDKKIDKKKCEAIWKKLNQAEKEAIIEYIPHYHISQPEKKYRRHPQTFLNNRSWENELINPKTENEKSHSERQAERLARGEFRNPEDFGINW